MNDALPPPGSTPVPGGTHVVTDYLGCRGRLDFGATGLAVQAEQRTRAGLSAIGGRERLLLSGPVTGPITAEGLTRIARAAMEGRPGELANVPGEVCGSLITERGAVLFRSASSQEALLYRRDGDVVRWSTDPTDLLDDGDEPDREALWRACRGDIVSVYRDLTPLRPGHLVVFEKNATTTVHYEPVTPLEVPRRTSLAGYADVAHELIVEATRPYAGEKVGILLSGGLDSGAVLSGLVENGADVTAYHMASDDPLADESGYARAMCEHLGVPFVPVAMDHGDGYLSHRWHFPLPYNATGFQWLERIADRVHADGVSLLTWGREGDMVFGPERYGLHEVLFGDLPLREKAAMCRGLVCSRWELSRILRSIRPSVSVLDDYLPVAENAKATDFLTPMPDAPDNRFDAEYLPADHCAALTIWRPRGILLCNPLGAKNLLRLSARLPHAYRVIPYQGRMITKPVLRLMLSTRLPERVWRRYGRLWLDSPHKNYVLTHRKELAGLLGPDSHVARLGLIDQRGLAQVIADPAQLRRHSEALISTAMTELFLRSRARAKEGRSVPVTAG
ncbi:asparagine synthase-related protein [Nonomuraea typhae]|uniref:asparagine synthase-related protein n=1 Tax=Nonomuraea typhae TaxID=2603600 RepID=UPI0012FABE61|nr:asparagine synthase-related protein [Nonomuraea typhae]